MKKLLITSLFIISLFYVNAQQSTKVSVSTKMSEIFKDNKSKVKLAFSTKDNEGGIFIGRRYNKGYLIAHYNADLTLVEEYDFELKTRSSSINNAFMSGNKLCLIKESYDKSTKSKVFTAYLSPNKNLNFTEKHLVSITKKELNSGISLFGNTIDSDFLGDYQISENQEYIVFAFDIRDKKLEKHKIIVFNNALEKQYETLFVRAVKDRKFQLQNIDVDETNGSVYLLGKVFTKANRKKKRKEGRKYQYELTKINKDDRQTLVFDSGTNYIATLKTIIRNDKLSCVGFYSEKKEYKAKGLVYFDIDNMKIKNTVYSPFSQQFLIDKYGKKKQKELRNMVIRDVFFTDKNELLINAEEYYEITTYNQNGSSRTTYFFMDIVSAKMDEKGKLIWARNINKKQMSSGYSPPYLSYISTYANGKNYFLINGSKTIKKLSNNRVQFKSSHTNLHNLYVIEIDEKGNVGYQMLLNVKEVKMSFAVNRSERSTDGKNIIFQGKKGTKKRILKITF